MSLITRLKWTSTLVFAVAIVALVAQERDYAPTCTMCPGTYIANSEIQAYVKRGFANQLTDQQIRQVDIGKANVGVAVVTRGRINNPDAVVAEHDLVSEVYHVIDGSGTLVLGPDLVGKVRRPATETTVRLLNGPGNNAKAIQNGVSYQLSAGDVVVIPAGTGHQFTRIDDHITYLMVRVDPDKVTPHKTEADSKADLQTDGRVSAGGGAGAVVAAARTDAQQVCVMTSGGFTAAFLDAAPDFERANKAKVTTSFGASMGGAPDSIPSRLDRGEPADVVILAREALDDLVAKGKVVRGSQVDLVRSTIGMAVRAGAPKPDISTVDALKRTLLAAKSIAYSASASGVYLSTELFPQLGIAEAIKAKSRRIESERVGTVVARGDAEIGFQQVSELLPIAGIDYVGPLPEAVQRVTVFSAGIASGAKNLDAARALIRYLSSAQVAPVIRKTGLEPIGP